MKNQKNSQSTKSIMDKWTLAESLTKALEASGQGVRVVCQRENGNDVILGVIHPGLEKPKGILARKSIEDKQGMFASLGLRATALNL